LFGDLHHCGFHGLENLKIARATAEISGERFADLIAARMRISIEQGLCGYQYSRRTIPALCRSKVGKSILQRVELGVFTESFYRKNVPSMALERQHKAGKHRLAVQ
jgi:hypothetical protein